MNATPLDGVAASDKILRAPLPKSIAIMAANWLSTTKARLPSMTKSTGLSIATPLLSPEAENSVCAPVSKSILSNALRALSSKNHWPLASFCKSACHIHELPRAAKNELAIEYSPKVATLVTALTPNGNVSTDTNCCQLNTG